MQEGGDQRFSSATTYVSFEKKEIYIIALTPPLRRLLIVQCYNFDAIVHEFVLCFLIRDVCGLSPRYIIHGHTIGGRRRPGRFRGHLLRHYTQGREIFRVIQTGLQLRRLLLRYYLQMRMLLQLRQHRERLDRAALREGSRARQRARRHVHRRWRRRFRRLVAGGRFLVAVILDVRDSLDTAGLRSDDGTHRDAAQFRRYKGRLRHRGGAS